MSSLNLVQLIGNLGQDPDVKTFQNGGRVCNLSIATSERWKDKATGERKERTQWTRVAIFNDALVGIAEKYLRKGSKVYISGQLETRKFTDAQGVEKYSTEVVLRPFNGQIVMLGDGRGGGGSDAGDAQEPPQPAPSGGQQRRAPDLDDSIPF